MTHLCLFYSSHTHILNKSNFKFDSKLIKLPHNHSGINSQNRQVQTKLVNKLNKKKNSKKNSKEKKNYYLIRSNRRCIGTEKKKKVK